LLRKAFFSLCCGWPVRSGLVPLALVTPQFVPTEELFNGRHFDQQIVVLCVRWYLSFKLSFRDLVAIDE
jgi:hypothetical protein